MPQMNLCACINRVSADFEASEECEMVTKIYFLVIFGILNIFVLEATKGVDDLEDQPFVHVSCHEFCAHDGNPRISVLRVVAFFMQFGCTLLFWCPLSPATLLGVPWTGLFADTRYWLQTTSTSGGSLSQGPAMRQSSRMRFRYSTHTRAHRGLSRSLALSLLCVRVHAQVMRSFCADTLMRCVTPRQCRSRKHSPFARCCAPRRSQRWNSGWPSLDISRGAAADTKWNVMCLRKTMKETTSTRRI
jgi:hypothetical protein